MKNEIIKGMMDVSYCPPSELLQMNIDLNTMQKFPIEQVVTLGTAFKPLMQLANFAKGNTAGQSGIYFVNTFGKTMFKSGEDYIGNLQTSDGRVGGGVARLKQLPLDPTMMCMAVALMSVEKKLDSIHEAQKEIIDFLELKEEAKLKGNINALTDILNNYKFNWDNETYKNNKHVLVQDIKRNAEQSIILHQERLVKQLSKNSFFHNNKMVSGMIDKITLHLDNYQLSLYTFAFSSFLEIMLLENFDTNYLNAISDKIVEYLGVYDDFFKVCLKKIKNISNSSFEGVMLKSLASTSSGAGKLVEKIPGINKSQLDENLISMGDKLKDAHINRVNKFEKLLSESQKDYVSVFVQNIQTIDQLYNKPMQVMFDEKNIYITNKI